jgi:hypothetical protein
MESIGFKEWALVCGALGRGEQSVLLRKGGIAEGRAGFAFRHSEFFLFPTFFHEQTRLTRLNDVTLAPRGEGQIEIDVFAEVEEARFVSTWQTAAALAPLHLLKPEVVRERFDHDGGNGIHVALVRAFRVSPAWHFADEARYGGCRSWVKLPERPADLRLEPAVSDGVHSARLAQFRAIVDDASVATAPTA